MDENTKADRIRIMEQFAADIMRHFNSSTDLTQLQRDELRRRVNENNRAVRKYVIEAGCFKTVTISPPPVIGGLLMKNTDPFDDVFGSFYEMSLIPSIRDMIEQAIGVIKDPDFGHDLPKHTALKRESIRKRYAFIAMSMDPANNELDDVLDAIKEACERCT